MALQPRIIACGTKMAVIGMAIRFIGGPLVMSAASIAVGLKGVRLHTAIVQVIIMTIACARDRSLLKIYDHAIKYFYSNYFLDLMM